ncbi:MAG: DUF5749 family beta-barrel protein [Candidatus Thermoplasmatota archaeon]
MNEILIFGLLAVFIVVVVLIGYFFIREKKSRKQMIEDEEGPGYACRFVVDGKGNTIGESVTVDNDVLIIKADSRYIGVPLKHVERKDKKLLVKGLLDEKKAEKLGEEWRKRSYKEIDQPIVD